MWLESVNSLGLIEIKDNVNLSSNVHIGALNSIFIGDNVLIGSNVSIIDHSHGEFNNKKEMDFDIPPNKRNLWSKGNIYISNNVWICDSVTITGNVNIGYGSVIAAHSLVNKDIPSKTIWGGVPAKQLWP